jgi:hydroxymethylglutaryl-CoA lyase
LGFFVFSQESIILSTETIINKQKPMKIIECPRDAIQGWKSPVATALKVEYLNTLLQVGFDTLDFGSFVSPKAIPQMADTAEVYHQLQLEGISTKLLAIIANLKGAEQAVLFEHITYLDFLFYFRNFPTTQYQ